MRRTTRNSRVVAVVALLSLQGIPAAAAPPLPPEQVTYQGVLLDGQGAPQTGNVDLAVRIYDAGIGGTLVYLQDFPAVPLADGVFTVVLGPTGEGTDLPVDPLTTSLREALIGDVGPTSPGRFLEVTIGEEGALSRSPILTVPYALEAARLEGLQASELQSRVAGLCPPGQAIQSIQPDGSVTCELGVQGGQPLDYTTNTSSNLDQALFTGLSWDLMLRNYDTDGDGVRETGGPGALCDDPPNQDDCPLGPETPSKWVVGVNSSDGNGNWLHRDHIFSIAFNLEDAVTSAPNLIDPTQWGCKRHWESQFQESAGGDDKFEEVGQCQWPAGEFGGTEKRFRYNIIGRGDKTGKRGGLYQWKTDLETPLYEVSFGNSGARFGEIPFSQSDVIDGLDPAIPVNGSFAQTLEHSGEASGIALGLTSSLVNDAQTGATMGSMNAIDGLLDIRGAASSRSVGAASAASLKSGYTATASAANTVTSLRGLDVLLDFSGSNGGITTAEGIRVNAPIPPGSGTTIGNLNGIQIGNMGGHAPDTHALKIAAQSAPTQPERRNNLHFGGGDVDNGHLQFAHATFGGHLWYDAVNDHFCLREGLAPTASSAPCDNGGRAIVHGTKQNNHGPMYWGVSDSAGAGNWDTGHEVCNAEGLDCVDSDVMSGDGSTTNCSDSHPQGANFWVFCK